MDLTWFRSVPKANLTLALLCNSSKRRQRATKSDSGRFLGKMIEETRLAMEPNVLERRAEC